MEIKRQRRVRKGIKEKVIGVTNILTKTEKGIEIERPGRMRK